MLYCQVFIVTGVILGKLLEKYRHAVTPKQKRTSVVLFSCILLVLTPMALGLYYPTMTESMHSVEQNTHALVSGNDFYLTHGNFSYNQVSLGVHYKRMVEATYHTVPLYQNGEIITYSHIFKETVPDHFGYQKNMRLNQSLPCDTYLSVNENIVTYYSVTPVAKYMTTKYTNTDSLHLEQDSSVQKYYSNPNMRLYIIV